MTIKPTKLKDRFNAPYEIFIEHYWWDGFWGMPYGVVLLGNQEYTQSFRTKFMARRYAKRLAKKLSV